MEVKDLGWALQQLKSGKRVARDGWNGKGMWLVLVPADEWDISVKVGRILPKNTSHSPWIAMKTSDNGLVPWLASQTDMLADDWALVE